MKFLILPLFCVILSCNTADSETNVKPDNTNEVPVNVEAEIKTDNTVDLLEKKAEVLLEEVTEDVVDKEELISSEYIDTDWEEYEASMKQDYSYVILISTKSYDAALNRAEEAAEKLGYPLNLRELSPNDEIGLSLPSEVCEQICGGGMGIEFPQYLPRDNYGDTKYVSVEYSDGYQGFTKGYYIVVAASGKKGSTDVIDALKEVKKIYEDAYAKTCGVWMGCMC